MATIAIAIVRRAITIRKEIKKRADTKKGYKKLRAITLQRAIDKSPILNLQYWKNYLFNGVPKTNLNFGGTNNIFAHHI